MDFRNYRIKSPVKSFRDLEVYQKTIQLSDEITHLSFLKDSAFDKDKEEMKVLAEKIPKLIAEAYGDKFDSKEIAHKKLTEAITLITNAVTKIDLLRQRFMDDKEPAPAPSSKDTMPTLSAHKATLKPDDNRASSPAEVASAGAVSAEVRREAKEILDKLLTRYQIQKIKVLNLRKAWDRVFASYDKDGTGKNIYRK